MNTDRCYHIPTAPGQTMCTCQDNRMTLELIIELQADYIVQLRKRLDKQEPKVYANTPRKKWWQRKMIRPAKGSIGRITTAEGIRHHTWRKP